MKRTLALAVVAAAVLAPATAASADHLCVTSNDQDIVCAPHPEEWIASGDPICVYRGSTKLICV